MSNTQMSLPNQVDQVIANTAGLFVSTLTQYKWDLLPESQLIAAKSALTKNDYIMKIACGDPEAVNDALVKSAILGLDLTEGKRQGWLLPRKNQAGKTVITLQVGYKGVEAIHQRMGVIDRLVVRTIRANDKLEWSGDDQEKPVHTADWQETEEKRGAISGAFAITYYPDKSINVVVAGIEEIFTKHRDVSDSYKTYAEKKKKGEYAHPPPWVSNEQAMVEKTMAYISSKQWPANIRDKDSSSKILSTLHEVDTNDYYQKYTEKEKEYFDAFIEAKDSLGIYLFSRRVDIDSYTALFSTFQKGDKTIMKGVVRIMEKEGSDSLAEIKRGLDHEDEFAVKENIDGCLEITTKLLMNDLTDHQKSVFTELLGV